MRDDIHPDRVVSMLWPARCGLRLAREVLCVVQRTLALGVVVEQVLPAIEFVWWKEKELYVHNNSIKNGHSEGEGGF